MTRRRPWRFLLAVLAGLALVEAGWVAAFQWAETSGRLSRWLARRPDTFALSYDEVSSWFPGHVRVGGLRVAGQTARWQWRATAELVHATVSPWPLLARDLRFAEIRGEGITFQARCRADDENAAAERAPRLPAIPEFPLHTEVPDRPPSKRPPWSFEFPNIVASRVREVWIEELRFRGLVNASGGFSVVDRREARIRADEFRIGSGTLALGGQPIAVRLSGEGKLRFLPFEYKQLRGRAVLTQLSGEARLRGAINEAVLLESHLPRPEWLEFDARPSEFEANVIVRRGRLGASSRFHATREGRRIALFGIEVEGDGDLDFAVTRDATGDRGDLSVVYRRFEVRRSEAPRADAVGEGLSLRLLVRDLRLSERPDDGQATFDLGTARLADLTTLQPLVPPASEIELQGGSGAIAARFEADLAKGTATGSLEANVDDLRFTFAGLPVAGTAVLNVPLASSELAARRFSIAGARLDLTQFTVEQDADAKPAVAPGWWSRVDFERGAIHLSRPGRLTGDLRFDMRDSAPLIALYSARKDLPDWLARRLLDTDVGGTASIDWRRGALTFSDVKTAVQETRIEARYSASGARRRGRLLVEWRKLALGVDLADGRRQFRLRNAREWFEGPESPDSQIGF